MPSIFTINGYKIFFWSNESGEPPHIHVAKIPSANSTKIWLEPIKIAHNKSRIPQKDLNKILLWLKQNQKNILSAWHNYFKN